MSATWKNFVWETAERAVKTAAQIAVGLLLVAKTGVGDAVGVHLSQVDFGELVELSLGGALLSVLTSFASATLPLGGKGSPSLAPKVKTRTHRPLEPVG